MKKTVLLSIFSFLLFNLFSQNNEATLKETTDWMSSKVEGEYEPILRQYFNVVLSWDDEKKMMQYTSFQAETLLGKPKFGSYVIEFDPKNIDPKGISIREFNSGENYYVKIHFSCNNGAGCIKSYNVYSKGNGELSKNEEANLKSYDIVLYSEAIKKNGNLPKRFIEAFKHLIFLRGGTGEKF